MMQRRKGIGDANLYNEVLQSIKDRRNEPWVNTVRGHLAVRAGRLEAAAVLGAYAMDLQTKIDEFAARRAQARMESNQRMLAETTLEGRRLEKLARFLEQREDLLFETFHAMAEVTAMHLGQVASEGIDVEYVEPPQTLMKRIFG